VGDFFSVIRHAPGTAGINLISVWQDLSALNEKAKAGIDSGFFIITVFTRVHVKDCNVRRFVGE
jgi:hypothetical protein